MNSKLTRSVFRFRSLALALLASLAPVANHGQEAATRPITNQTEKVVALLKSIETGATAPVGYINPQKYTKHNLAAADGLAGLGAVLQALPKGSAKVNTVRAFSDGNFVVAHTDYNFFGPKIGFDIFRFENGLIVEHGTISKKNPRPQTRAVTR